MQVYMEAEILKVLSPVLKTKDSASRSKENQNYDNKPASDCETQVLDITSRGNRGSCTPGSFKIELEKGRRKKWNQYTSEYINTET